MSTRFYFIASLIFALAACTEPDDATTPRGSYLFPVSYVGVAISSPTGALAAHNTLESFAARHGLRRYESIRQRPWEEVSYHPSPPNAQYGFSLESHQHSPECLVIRLDERSGTWTHESLEAFSTLIDELDRLPDSEVMVLVTPKKEQNWNEWRNTGFIDPEIAASAGEYCTRMGLEDPYTTR